MKQQKDISPKRSLLYNIVTALLAIANTGVAAGLVVSAYSGAINPVSHPTAPALAMTFPIWLACTLGCVIVTLIVRWKAAVIGICGMLIAMPQILQYSPLHLPSHAADENDTFTFMSYNVFGLADQNGVYYGGVNPTLSYILAQDHDIVCIQELSSLNTNPALHVTASQIASIHCQYP